MIAGRRSLPPVHFIGDKMVALHYESADADSSVYKVGELPAAIHSPDTSAVTVVV